MENFDIFNILQFIIPILIFIYLASKVFSSDSLVEGLTNNEDLDTTNILSGEAGSASTYAANIKAETIQLQDELLVEKYRKDYENIIINLDDYIGYLMLKTILNTETGSNIDNSLEKLNMLNSSRESLNQAMKFLDNI
jgi:hypothetical protein